MKKIIILGSTGSIGKNACNIIKNNLDQFEIIGLSCNKNIDILIKQIDIFNPKIVCVFNKDSAEKLRTLKKDITILSGIDGLIELCEYENYDTLLTAVVGQIGLEPTYCAIKKGKQICLANKETLVAGGKVIMEAVKISGNPLLPVDSEHSAIFQSLKNEKPEHISKLILTASGGPFLNKKISEFSKITPEMALKHPNWSMGGKITIDSATLMNKGLEVIEAKWLFNIPIEKIDVVIHPQSIIHSLVEFIDDSIIAQLGVPDMQLPIQYALAYPNRIASHDPKKLDLTEIAKLTFFKPDLIKFPCLKIAINSSLKGKTFPAVMNAANEIAVENFLKKKIKFTDIPQIIEDVVNEHIPENNETIENILKADSWARKTSLGKIGKLNDKKKKN